MPKIQLIKRDSSVLELDAENIQFDLTRIITAHALPIFNTRAAIDLNQTNINIILEGIITDDVSASPGVGSAFTIDTSINGSQTLEATWYELFASWAAVKTELDGVEIRFKSIGQINANLGEDITIKLKNGAGSSTVATNSIILVNIASTTSSDSLSDTIASALGGAQVKVNTVTTNFSDIFTTTQSSGQLETLSQDSQGGTGFNGEKITITNKTAGSAGDHTVTVQKDNAGQAWTKQFLVTNALGGQAAVQMTMEDKVQDLLNLANMSAGGGLVSPNALAGSVVDLPEGVASFDASKFLRVDEAKTVKKYIVGIRIPYESLASSTTGNRVLRQYLIPSGIGTDYSASANTAEFDPTNVVNNQTVRPNPFLEQGIAIPAILTMFNPNYNAGDGYWSYSMTVAAVEQLVGI
tara:strand:- start:2976 stop:4205 length:1230 start_codon:yes stop_codon:yes gene_type:complete